MDIVSVLGLVESGGAIILAAILILAVIVPLQRTMGRTLQNLVGRIERLETAANTARQQELELLREIADIDARNAASINLLRIAIRVAFAGRSNGHTWEDAKRHYHAASQVLADEDADSLLREVERRITEETEEEPKNDE